MKNLALAWSSIMMTTQKFDRFAKEPQQGKSGNGFMIKFYTSFDSGFLNILKSQLETAGIQTLFKNEFPPAAGELSRAVAPPELWIFNDGDLEVAATILKDMLNRSKNPPKKWQCPHCGEWLEGQFEICWKCGIAKE